jgi:hypothetical protein
MCVVRWASRTIYAISFVADTHLQQKAAAVQRAVELSGRISLVESAMMTINFNIQHFLTAEAQSEAI